MFEIKTEDHGVHHSVSPPLNISTPPSFKVTPPLDKKHHVPLPPSPPIFWNGNTYSLIHRVATCLNEALQFVRNLRNIQIN